MAAYTANRTKHATLTTTTVDTVTIGAANGTRRFGSLEVVNRDGAQTLTFVYTTDGSTPADPTALVDDSWYVGPNSSVTLDLNIAYPNIIIVKLVGSANAYSVHCADRFTVTPR